MITGQPAITVQAVAVAAAPSVAPSAAPLKDEQPAPEARIASAYPTISARLPISRGASIATLHLILDSVDVTTNASYAGQYVTYIPRDGLAQGTHMVSISGTDSDGKKFQTSWSFETTTPPEPDTAGAPTFNSYGAPFQSAVMFNVSGNQFVGGAPINVQMTAPPGGQAFAFVCTSAWQFPLNAAPLSQFYTGLIPTAAVGTAINCPVTAMYVGPDGTVTYAPFPVFVQLLPRSAVRPTAAPQPTRVPLPGPVHRTPSPVMAPTIAPTIAPVPPAKYTPQPRPRVIVPKVRPTPRPQ